MAAEKKMVFVEKLKKKFGYDEPIFTSEIIDTFPELSVVRVHQLIRAAEEEGYLKRFQHGIHFFPSDKTAKLNIGRIIERKYVTDGKDIYGLYEGLIKLLPSMFRDPETREEEVYTNREGRRMREVMIGNKRIIIRKSRLKINNENYKAYALLEWLSHHKSINAKLRKEVTEYLNEVQLTRQDVFSLAAYFPGKAMKNLIAGGLFDLLAA